MIRVRAALGGDVDLRHLASEFRRVHAGLHLEFLDTVDRGQEGIRIEVHILIDDTVERVLVVFATLPGDREILGRAIAALSAAGSAAGTARVVRTDVRTERYQVDEVTAIERQLQDLFVLDDGADRRIRGVDHRGAAGHLDRHLHRSKLQRKIETGRLLHLQLDAASNLALKALQVDFDVVYAGEQIWKHIAARGVGLCLAHGVGAGVGDRDGCPDEDGAARVGDRPCDLSEGLSGGRRCQCKQQAENEDPVEDSAHGVPPPRVRPRPFRLSGRAIPSDSSVVVSWRDVTAWPKGCQPPFDCAGVVPAVTTGDAPVRATDSLDLRRGRRCTEPGIGEFLQALAFVGFADEEVPF